MSATSPQKPLFFAIMIALPIALLLLLEGGLRVIGFGQSIELFIASEQTGLHQPNPKIIQRYFHDTNTAPKVAPDTFFFALDKPPNTIRIVLMGGSSAAGFPYGRFGSPAGMLQQQLKQLYPLSNIEVISVAMASINSYALRDFTPDVIAINPDAVLIYAGHNEFLGIMGVGSNLASLNSHWLSIAFLSLKDWRLFQLLQSAFTLIQSPPEPATSGRTVMASVAKEKNIALDSPLYHAGIKQFEHNLDAILGKFSDAGVPVLIGNLVSNEKDQPPFESEPREQGSERSAKLRYEHAEQAFDNNQFSAARIHYSAARDLDLLRFRAPSEFNQLISSAASNHHSTLIDIDSIIRDDTDHGIIGYKHMLEHLHPNARGYFLIAYGFLQGLQQQRILEPSSNVTPKTLWQYQPLNRVDHLFARYKVQQLTSDYPFTSKPKPFTLGVATSPFEQLAIQRFNGESWLDQQQQLLALFQQQQDYANAANVAGLLFDALQTNVQAAQVASKLYLRANQYNLALYYANQAHQLAPTNTSIQLTLAQTLFRSQRRAESIEQLKQVLQREPDNSAALKYLRLIGGSN